MSEMIERIEDSSDLTEKPSAGEGVDRQLQTLRTSLSEAQQEGLTAAAKYYQAKIDELGDAKSLVEVSDSDELGSEALSEIKEHRDNWMNYERRANELEKSIQSGEENPDRQSEVRTLREKACAEKREMEVSQQRMKQDMMDPYGAEVSETGPKTVEFAAEELSFGGAGNGEVSFTGRMKDAQSNLSNANARLKSALSELEEREQRFESAVKTNTNMEQYRSELKYAQAKADDARRDVKHYQSILNALEQE